ncbi:MAG: class I SAM-dependent methyltransferase [Actinomycetota bacterium]|nr:class I SAM-dependent methyltransferase [Actinomycetota bacterium]
MDIWKYYAITHKRHVICNPMDKDKIYKLLELLNLEQRATVLDIGCGKGEILIRLAELFNISGIGVDISPYFLKDSRREKEGRVPNSDIKFMEMDGANYKNEENELFDLTMCIGASFAYGGFLNTINSLKKMTKPGGLLVLGEPYLLKELDPEYLKMSGIKKEDYATHRAT